MNPSKRTKKWLAVLLTVCVIILQMGFLVSCDETAGSENDGGTLLLPNGGNQQNESNTDGNDNNGNDNNGNDDHRKTRNARRSAQDHGGRHHGCKNGGTDHEKISDRT